MKKDFQSPTNPTNNLTIRAYDQCLSEYISGTEAQVQSHDPAVVEWIKQALNLITPHDKILEIGSGTGRDADFIESLGYQVQRSDASHSFIHYMQERGKDVLEINAIKDEIPRGFGLIFANAVFPHFTKAEAENIFKKIYEVLPQSGVFAFSVKLGEGEGWVLEKISQKRFIHYWNTSELFNVVQELGYKTIFYNNNIGVHRNHKWLNVVLKKL